jgi:hypothetical protein
MLLKTIGFAEHAQQLCLLNACGCDKNRSIQA